MENVSWPQLFYLILLLAAVGGWFFAEGRQSWGKTARQAAVWGLIFVGAIAVVGLWSDIRDDIAPRQAVTQEGTISVPQSFDGHYQLTLDLNGEPVDFIVDTGATDIVLTRADAARVGIDLDTLAFTGVANTANGTVRTARARISTVALGPIVDRGVPVSVNGGEMEGSLLGMAYLSRFERIEIADGMLVLER